MTAPAATNKPSPPTYSVPNAVELFTRRVAQSGAKRALRWKQDGQWQTATFGDWDKASREIAGGLAALGCTVDDRVSILANTRPEWVYCDVAILMTGAATVPIYQSNLATECEYILNDCGAKVCFVEDPLQLEKLVAQRAKLGKLEKIVIFNRSARLDKPDAKGRVEVKLEDVLPSGDNWVITLDALRESGRGWIGKNPGALAERAAALTSASLFTIVYTSGTTGPPKGAVLTHGNMVWEVDAMRPVLPLADDDEQLLFLPMAHIFAKVLAWVSIGKGVSMAFAESIAKIRDNLAELRPTFMCSVPRVLEKMYLAILGNRNASSPTKQKIFDWAFGVGREVSRLEQRHEPIPLVLGWKHALATRLVFEKVGSILGGRIKFLVSGGAPLSAEIAEFFHAAGILILEGWGLTETTAGTTINRVEKYKFGSVGVPVSGIEINIASDGEILVRGGSVMREYWNRAEATAEAIDKDGWFHTGDIGVLEDNVLRITDRKKDIIVNAGGKNIAPQNLENALKATPYISQVMVIGDKRPFLVALVTLNEDNVKKWAADQGLTATTNAELAELPEVKRLIQKSIDELNHKEPSYSSIKKFAILPADFAQETGELTPTLKVKRKFTSEKFKAIIDGLYGGQQP